MNRRQFIASLGLGAAAVSFGGLANTVAAIAPTTSATSVPLDGLLCVGDVFTIEGRYAVNPITRRATEHLQTFVVSAVNGPTITCQPRGLTISPSIAQPLGKRNVFGGTNIT